MARAPRVDREVQRIQSRLDYIKTKKHFVPDTTNLEHLQDVAHDGRVPRCGFFGSVTDSALQRLAYTANCSRIGSDVYPALRSCLSNFLARACLNADVLADHRGKTNITGPDVLYGLKAMDVHVHGTGKLKRLRPKVGAFQPDDYPPRFADDTSDGTIVYEHKDLIDDTDVNTILTGLAEYRSTGNIPRNSELDIIVKRFSKVRGPISVTDFDHTLRTSKTLVKAYYQKASGRHLVAFMILRPWNPLQLEVERIQRKTGHDVMSQSIPDHIDELIKFREMFCNTQAPVNVAGPVIFNEIDVDNPNEFQATEMYPTKLHINNSASVIKSIVKKKHWVPKTMDRSQIDEQTWLDTFTPELQTARSYSIHIVDMAFRSFYDQNTGNLYSYVTMEQMLHRALESATRDWRVFNNGLNYYQRAVASGGLILTYPKRLALSMTTDSIRFTKINVSVGAFDYEFTIDDTEILWRPVNLTGLWAP